MSLPHHPPHHTPKQFINAIILTSFFYGISCGMNTVSIPLLLAEYGLTKTTIGMLTAIDTGSILLVAPFIPWLTKHYGVIRLLIFAELLRAITVVLLPHWSGLFYWIFILLGIGIGNAAAWITVQSNINRLSTEGRRGLNIGLLTVSWALGAATGPLILSLLGPSMELIGPGPFSISAGISIIGLAPVLYCRDAVPVFVKSKGLKFMMLLRRAPLPVLGGFMSDYIFYSLCGFVVLYGIKTGLSPTEAGFLVTGMLTGSVMMEVPIGWLSDRIGRIIIMPVSVVVILIVSQMLPYATHHLWLTCLFAALSGMLAGLYTSSLALLGDAFKESDVVVASAGFSFLSSLGAICGLVTTGMAMDAWGKEGLTHSIGGVCCLYLILIGAYSLRKSKLNSI